MQQDENEQNISERITALLDELTDLLKPTGCDNPHCDHEHDHPIPEGPWIIGGWVLAVDIAAEGQTEVETWTNYAASTGIPRSQALGLGHSIVRWCGG